MKFKDLGVLNDNIFSMFIMMITSLWSFLPIFLYFLRQGSAVLDVRAGGDLKVFILCRRCMAKLISAGKSFDGYYYLSPLHVIFGAPLSLYLTFFISMVQQLLTNYHISYLILYDLINLWHLDYFLVLFYHNF